MSLVRWDPFRELEDMTNRLNRVFGREVTRAPGKEAMTLADWAPVVDIKETPEEYIIDAELPRVNKEDVKVNVKDGVLTLTGERKAEHEEKGKRFHRIERSYGSFMRSFTLPEDVEEAKLMANYKDGLLEIHLPKSPAKKPRTVEVKVS